MAKQFRTGTELVKQHAAGSGKKKFTPNIYWKAGDVKVIAWLGNAEEIAKVRLHQMVRIPDDSRESGIRYETLVCKKDPTMIDESDGICDLCDVVGHDASEKFVLRAVELDLIKEGKKVTGLKVATDKVKRDDGSEQEYPRWGLVIQASKNFFSYFVAYQEERGDIDEVAWEIQRDGGGTDTKYHSMIVTAGSPPAAVALPDLTEITKDIPGLMDLLEAMTADEKYAEAEALAPGSQPSFGNKKKSESGSVPSGDRATEFDKIREAMVPAPKEPKAPVEAY